MADIKPQVTALADTLKAHMTHAGAGVITVAADAFEKTLPEGLTMADVNKVYGHIGDLVPAMTLATGKMAEDVLKDKSIESVSADLKIGKGAKLEVNYDRSIERRKSVTDPEMITVHGNTTVKLTTSAVKSAATKAVRTSLSEAAAALAAKGWK